MVFNCVGCGRCCDPLTRPLQMTVADVRRLTRGLGYQSITDFLKQECVLTEFREEGTTLMGGGFDGKLVDASYVSYFFKRFSGEDEQSLYKPHGCRFLSDNRCLIYENRPMVCRKFPYVTVPQSLSLILVFYTKDEAMNCPGFMERPTPRRKWLSKSYMQLSEVDAEILESLNQGLVRFTEVNVRTK